MDLDDVHIAMLEALRRDSRTPVAALAREVGVSRANAYSRLGALEAAGVINGYSVDLNPIALGKPIAALVFVSLHQSQWQDFRARLPHVPEVEYFAVTTGQLDAMLLIRADNVERVHALVVGELAQWPSIKETETVFLMDEQRFDASLRLPPRPPLRAGTQHGATRFATPPTPREPRP